MHPELIRIGELSLPSYYTMITVGFLLLMYLSWRESKRVGIDPDDTLDLGLYMLLFGLIGARLLHVVADGYFWDYVHLCTDPLRVEVQSFIHVKCVADADCVAQDAGALCNPATGRCHPARDCLAALKFWHGGLAFFGGLLLATAAALVIIRRRRMPLRKVLDMGAWAVPLGLASGRVGCFLSGCCFGQVTEGPLGVRFPGYVAALGPDATCPPRYDLVTTGLLDSGGGQQVCAFGRPAFMDHVEHGLLGIGSRFSLPVHPTQLYEAGTAALIFAWVYFWRRRRLRYAGQAFWEFCVLYGVGRFAIEMVRADERGLWFGELVSTSQIIAVPFVAVGLWQLWRHRHAVETAEAN